MNFESLVEEVTVNLLKLAVTELPGDVKEALREAYCRERNPAGKAQLKAILENIKLAEETNTPICQDTGLISLYMKAGAQLGYLDKVEVALRRAVRRATKEIPLRPNTVNPFTKVNSGDNTGRFIPIINWEIVSGNLLEITVFPKGAGSENTCALKMMTPSEGVNGMKRFVVEAMIKAGAMPCPPVIIGAGIGGGADTAMKLAKKALLRPIDKPNRDKALAEMERELHDAVNSTGIGPMGLGGETTALAVKIDYAHRHPASFPVAVAFQCWAARRASARIHRDGMVEYLTHKAK